MSIFSRFSVYSPKQNIIANYVSSAWVGLIGFILIPLYVKYLGAESYGLIGVLISMQAWVTLLDMGLTQTLNREMARFNAHENQAHSIHDLLKSVETIYAVLAVLICIGVWLLSESIVNYWLNLTDMSAKVAINVMNIMGIIIALNWITALYKGAILGLQKQVWLSGNNIIFSSLRSIGVLVILVWVSPTITAFFLYQSLIVLIELVVVRRKVYAYLPSPILSPKFSIPALKTVWRFAFGVMLVSMLGLLLTQVDKLLISKILPLSEFGYYMIAMAVVSSLYIFISPISNAVSPVFASLVKSNQTESLILAYHKYTQLVALVTIPIALVMSFFSEHFLMLWTRDVKIVQAISLVLSVMVLGTLLNGFMQLPYLMQLAYGRTKLAIYVNSTSVGILIPALYFAVHYAGTIGAATIWLILNLAYVFLALPLLHKAIFPGELRDWYLKDVLPTLFIVFIGLTIVKLISPSPDIDAPWASFLTLLIGAVVAVTLALWVTPVSRHYFKGIFSLACKRI